MSIYDPIAESLGLTPIEFNHFIPKKLEPGSLAGSLNPHYGLRHSDEAKELMRQKKKGKKLSAEHKAKLSLISKGKPNPAFSEYVIRMNKENPPHLGKKHSEETKDKIRAAHSGRPKSLESVAKMKVSKTGHKMSDTSKANIAAGHRGLKQSPETIAKRIATTKARREAREKASCLEVSDHSH